MGVSKVNVWVYVYVREGVLKGAWMRVSTVEGDVYVRACVLW